MPIPINQQEMNRIFEVTDALGIHREKIRVRLAKKDPGSIKKDPSGLFEIVIPETTPFDQWVGDLREMLGGLGIVG